MNTIIKTITLLTAALGLTATASAAVLVHNTDFIADGTRTGFNGFEAIPNNGVHFTGGAGPYTEGGISVAQTNGDPGNDIWIGFNFWAGASGNAWYPDGGDSGFTSISLAGGFDFSEVGFNYGSGGGSTELIYELFDNGLMVASGTAPLNSGGVNYIGFSGGGFDTILIRDNLTSGPPVSTGAYQALAIDNVEVRGGPANVVPDGGSTLSLFGLGMIGVETLRRRLAKKKAV